MFRFLGQKILFKAVPGPVTRLSKGIVRSAHTSQSGVVGSAGTDGSLRFWLDHLEEQRMELEKEKTELREQLLNRFEKEKDRLSTRIEGYLVDIARYQV